MSRMFAIILITHVLAAFVGIGSVAFYVAAFFYPEVSRPRDIVWSALGLMYAALLWFFAVQMSAAILLGQLIAAVLLSVLGWQTLSIRREKTPVYQQTPVVITPEVAGNWAKNKINELRIAPAEPVPLKLEKRSLSEFSEQGPGGPIDPRRRRAYEYEFVEDGLASELGNESINNESSEPLLRSLTEAGVSSDGDEAPLPVEVTPPSAIADIISVEVPESKEPESKEPESEASDSKDLESEEPKVDPAALKLEAVLVDSGLAASGSAESEMTDTGASDSTSENLVSENPASEKSALETPSSENPALQSLAEESSVTVETPESNFTTVVQSSKAPTEQSQAEQSQTEQVRTEQAQTGQAQIEENDTSVQAQDDSDWDDSNWNDSDWIDEPVDTASTSADAAQKSSTAQPKSTPSTPSSLPTEKPSILAMPIILAGWVKDVVASMTKPKPSKPVIEIPRREPSIPRDAVPRNKPVAPNTASPSDSPVESRRDKARYTDKSSASTDKSFQTEDRARPSAFNRNDSQSDAEPGTKPSTVQPVMPESNWDDDLPDTREESNWDD